MLVITPNFLHLSARLSVEGSIKLWYRIRLYTITGAYQDKEGEEERTRWCKWDMERVGLKLTFRQYPAMHTNRMLFHCTTLQHNHNTGFILFLEVQIPWLFMTFHDQKKSNSMTFRTILGNEHIRSKYGNFKEQHNASFKPQIENKTLLYGNLHITTLSG